MHRLILALLSVVCLSGCSSFKGTAVPPITHPLDPQAYTWYPERAPAGPVLVFISIPRQEAVVYRNGIRIGRAAVSTGRAGHETPTGVFQILEKDREHYSTKYNGAPMPYMERLTWDGVALHTGFNPGQPDSHGCVRLPDGFARELFGVTKTGGTVIVSNSAKLPSMTVAPDFGTGTAAGGSAWSGKSGGGTVALVMSTTSRKIQAFQNGRKVGEVSVAVSGKMERFKGESVFLFLSEGKWQSVSGGSSFARMREEVLVPQSFKDRVRPILRPGTTLVVTSEPLGQRGAISHGVVSAQ